MNFNIISFIESIFKVVLKAVDIAGIKLIINSNDHVNVVETFCVGVILFLGCILGGEWSNNMAWSWLYFHKRFHFCWG